MSEQNCQVMPSPSAYWPTKTPSAFLFNEEKRKRKPELRRLAQHVGAESSEWVCHIDLRDGYAYVMAPYNTDFNDELRKLRDAETDNKLSPRWIAVKSAWRVHSKTPDDLFSLLGQFFPFVHVADGNLCWWTRFESIERAEGRPPYDLSFSAIWVDLDKVHAEISEEISSRTGLSLFVRQGEFDRSDTAGFKSIKRMPAEAVGPDSPSLGGFWTRHPHLLFSVARNGQPKLLSWNVAAALPTEVHWQSSAGGRRLLALFYTAAAMHVEPFVLGADLPSTANVDANFGRHPRTSEARTIAASIVSDVPIVALSSEVAAVWHPPRALAYVTRTVGRMVQIASSLDGVQHPDHAKPVVFTRQVLDADEEEFLEILIHELAHLMDAKTAWVGRNYPVHGHRWLIWYVILAKISGLCEPDGAGDYMTDAWCFNKPRHVFNDLDWYEEQFRRSALTIPSAESSNIEDAISDAEFITEDIVGPTVAPQPFLILEALALEADEKWHEAVGLSQFADVAGQRDDIV